MPASLKKDIKEFFCLYSEALETSKELLFSVGDPQNVYEACKYTADKLKTGYLENDHNLQLHVSQIHRLPAILRVYVGCAIQLFGDIEEADLLKIHIRSGKVTLLKYDDFENKALPELQQRVKIKMREQQIDFFDYGNEYQPQPLYIKTRYIPSDFPNYEKQRKFDKMLHELGLFTFGDFGPTKEEFHLKLHENNLRVDGYELIQCKT